MIFEKMSELFNGRYGIKSSICTLILFVIRKLFSAFNIRKEKILNKEIVIEIIKLVS